MKEEYGIDPAKLNAGTQPWVIGTSSPSSHPITKIYKDTVDCLISILVVFAKHHRAQRQHHLHDDHHHQYSSILIITNTLTTAAITAVAGASVLGKGSAPVHLNHQGVMPDCVTHLLPVYINASTMRMEAIDGNGGEMRMTRTNPDPSLLQLAGISSAFW